jgi:hypothetical protein
MHPIRRFKEGELVTKDDLVWNPQILYHYTTREGLVGILKSGTVWATDIGYPFRLAHVKSLHFQPE